VVDGVTGQPIARARVRMQRPQPAGTRSTLTNGEGVFELTQVPVGPLNVMVEKSTYMPGTYPEAGRTLRSGMSERRIVTAGQVVDDVVIRMYRGASISGRVFDAHGDPVEFVQVAVMRVGGGPNRPVGSITTNDLGEFRVPRLQPGNYLLYATARGGGGRPEPDLQATGEPLPEPVPTYYPGAVAADQAQVLTVERGQALSGVDFVMNEGTPVLINGMVVRSDGVAISGGFVNARIGGRELPGGFGAGASVRPDGSFRMTLPPGQYVLQANTFGQSPNPQTQRAEQTGMARISVGRSPTENVVI
jgi:hypothetical protein